VIPPDYDGYFADPFVLRLDDGSYVAYGSSGAPATGGHVFEALVSDDLLSWHSCGPVLARLDPSLGDEYWAPEVIHGDGAYWMYFSVGHGIGGHQIRVARSESPLGPFADQGVSLTPRERFAIDAHPFVDFDGAAYLFFARDVLDTERPGTHLAVVRLADWTATAGEPVAVLAPDADWQIYERDREMYGARHDWYTLEGPSVVRRHGRYWLTYSGGAWTGPGYSVSWAVADSPLGPWRSAPAGRPSLLQTTPDLIGPGHNSLTISPDGGDVIAFHAWDAAHTQRQLHVHRITFEPEGPRVDGPIRGHSTIQRA
jgi:GH43 family beta-xylosidase